MNTGGAQELQGMNTTNTTPRIIKDINYDEYRGKQGHEQVHVQ